MADDKLSNKKDRELSYSLYKSGGHYGVISIKEIIKNE